MDLGIYPPHINALRSIQLKKFKYTAKWLNDHTLFYKTKFRKAAVDPTDIKNLDDIKKLPFTTNIPLQGQQACLQRHVLLILIFR
jgi:phenylacetate-coenzyme A ligase PaaK-like adenylate-forming protein